VSGQIAKLEESLGTKLFQRRPFALSPAGLELFEFIKPFFDNIEIVGEKLRQNRSPQLRIAAPSIVLHDYIPELLQKLRTKFPEFRLYLHEAARAEAERLLLARDVDFAITLVEKKSRAGIQVQPFARSTVDSARSQKFQADSRRGVVEARQDRRNANQFPANGSRSRFLSARS
jgi:DNA-binding transcriptional LysR family regulator